MLRVEIAMSEARLCSQAIIASATSKELTACAQDNLRSSSAVAYTDVYATQGAAHAAQGEDLHEQS